MKKYAIIPKQQKIPPQQNLKDLLFLNKKINEASFEFCLSLSVNDDKA